MKNKLTIISVLLVSTFWSCLNVVDQTAEAKHPNILWILAEDFSPDLGCYNYPLVHTPNIDGLASAGVRFTRVFTTAPVCAPSRTALATGMYQTSINAHHMRYPDSLKNELPSDVIPLNELMRRQGYQTAKIIDDPGKGKEDWSFRSDLAHYDLVHWDSLAEDKPFFGVVNLRLTHRPFERDTVRPIDPKLVKIPPYYPDHDISRQDWAAYLETAQILDQQVGQVIDELARRNLDENTIVFFFADHGRPMSRGKNSHFDSGNHIPLIIYCPTGLAWNEFLPAGATNEDLISAIDITATSLALTGANKPTWMQGRVFLGKNKEEARNYIFCASDRIGESYRILRSVRSKEYKYIRNFNPGFSINATATAYRKAMHPIHHLLNIYQEKGLLTPAQQMLVDPFPEELLFNVIEDPYEVNNLLDDADHQQVLQEMRQQLKDWQDRTTDHGMTPDSEALQDAFRVYAETSAANHQNKIIAREKEVREAIEHLSE